MMNRLWAMKNRKDKRGFTLIELIIVIAILAILMAIAIPAMSAYMKDAETRTAESNARTVYGAAAAAVAEHDAVAVGTAADFVAISALTGDYQEKVKELLGPNFKGFIRIEVVTAEGADKGKITVHWKETATATHATYPKP